MSRTQPSGSLRQLVQANAVELLDHPEEPQEGWHGLPETSVKTQLRESGFYSRESGYCTTDHPNCNAHGTRCDVRIWRLTRIGKTVLEQLDEPNTLPCGHQGLRNLRDAGYTCQNEDCNAEFGEKIAKQLY